MTDYVVVTLRLAPMNADAADVLAALVIDAGAEGTELTDDGLRTYINADTYVGFDYYLRRFGDIFPGVSVSTSVAPLPHTDWNETWEREGFRPIVEPGLFVIRRPDQQVEKVDAPYTILINPRMAFGTGSHQTTHMLVTWLLTQPPMTDMRCLDMGCGTGILAICMARRGATPVIAIDVDEDSVANSQLNFALNGVDRTATAIHGDATAIEGEFALIVANIHRNIIIADMPIYHQHLAAGGRLVVSGFFNEDVNRVVGAATMYGLSLKEHMSRGDWAALVFQKP